MTNFTKTSNLKPYIYIGVYEYHYKKKSLLYHLNHFNSLMQSTSDYKPQKTVACYSSRQYCQTTKYFLKLLDYYVKHEELGAS